MAVLFVDHEVDLEDAQVLELPLGRGEEGGADAWFWCSGRTGR